MNDKLFGLITLGFARGYRTFMCCGLIILLAALNHWKWITVPADSFIALIGVAIIFLKAGMPPGSAAALLCALCLSAASVPAFASDDPALYVVQSAALEAHHGPLLASSGVGALTHVGVDYGAWAIESVLETPLYTTQDHTRRSIGADVLWFPTQPYTSPEGIGTRFVGDWIVPYAVAGAGYYWGSDPLRCPAVDVGVGCRFYVSPHFWLQLEAKDAVPFDGQSFVVPARFQIVSIGIGARY